MATLSNPVMPQLNAGNMPGAGAGVTRLLVTYVFLLISRIFEFAAAYGAGNLYLMMLTSTAGVLAALFNGGLFRSFRSRPAKVLVCFTACVLLATATSSWHMGSINVLKDIWLRSILSFLVVAGLTATYKQLRSVAIAAGLGGLVAALALLVAGASQDGRFAFTSGTFGNANEVAYHLLFVLPLAGYAFFESGKLRKILILAGSAIALVVVLKTGSRGGLIILGAQLLMVLIHVPGGSKIKVLMIGGVAGILLMTVVSRSAIDRYLTLTSQESGDEAFESAEASGNARIIHLKESLMLTLQHPLFGVGPGVFQSASADYENEQGKHAFWRETHNAYTQVSSECGIPALILFLGVLLTGWRGLSRAQREAKARKDPQAGNLAFCLKLTSVAFIVNGFFTSNAYEYYLPLLAALTGAVELTGLKEPAPPPTVLSYSGQRGPAFGKQPPAPAGRTAGIRPVAAVPGMRPGFAGSRPKPLF